MPPSLWGKCVTDKQTNKQTKIVLGAKCTGEVILAAWQFTSTSKLKLDSSSWIKAFKACIAFNLVRTKSCTVLMDLISYTHATHTCYSNNNNRTITKIRRRTALYLLSQ